MPFLPPNQQRQSTEGQNSYRKENNILITTAAHLQTMEFVSVHVQVSPAEEKDQYFVRRNEILLSLQQR